MENRITLTLLDPNPLFKKWLNEWLEYAKQKNSLKKHALTKAVESIGKYPLVLHSGRDCCMLDGFGSKICRMLDTKLEQHKLAHTIRSEVEHNQSVQDVLQIAKKRMVKARKQQNEPIARQLESTNLVIPSGYFEIILLVDTQETAG